MAFYGGVSRRGPWVALLRLACGAVALNVAVWRFGTQAVTTRTATDYSLQTFGMHRASYKIAHDGRVFYYGKPDRAEHFPALTCMKYARVVAPPRPAPTAKPSPTGVKKTLPVKPATK